MLRRAGTDIDADPHDATRARRRALTVRHLVERSCALVLDRFGWIAGPRPLATERATARRFADLQLYLRQHGGARDLIELGTP